MKRRDLLKGGAAALAGGLLPLAGCGPLPAARAAGAGAHGAYPVGRARNVIFYAYDGFTFEDLGTAHFFALRHRGQERLALEALLARAAAGSMLPPSLTSIVTDSAAATTAWSTGRKVVNDALSMYPDGRPLTTILELAREAGRATGLVTTTRITHATPAGWIAKVPGRAMEDEIAAQYLAFAPEVLLGGGRPHFDAARRRDGRDVAGEFAARGYGVVETAEALAETNASRLLGLFAADHLPFEIDRVHQGVAAPTLAEMTAKALAVLAGAAGGFVLQVEAGRIDHANHHNDPGAAVWDILAADDALRVLVDHVDRHPDTLLLLASDHGTGGGAVYGSGAYYRYSNPAFDRLGVRTASYEHLRRVVGDAPPPDRLRAAAREYFGVELTPARAEAVARVLQTRRWPGHSLAHRTNPNNALHWLLTEGDAPGPDLVNVSYATGAHLAGPVPLLAYGAGVAPRPLGMVDNTELFGWMLHALGIRFENPLMTEAEALRLGATAPARPPEQVTVHA
jgi:alkaline phosphatase